MLITLALPLTLSLFPQGDVTSTMQPAAEIKLFVSKRVIAKDLPGWQLVSANSDCSVVAWWEQEGGRFRVVFNGKPASWRTGRPPTFERMGEGDDAPPMYLGVDGRRHFDFQRVNTFEFSRTGGRCAYIYETEGKRIVVVAKVEKQRSEDGVARPFRSGDSDDEWAPIFSADGRRIAYVYDFDGKQSVVVDGVMGKRYEMVDALQFSPNGERFVHRAYHDKRLFSVLDGKEVDGFDYVFSLDGKRAACVKQDRDGDAQARYRVCVDGKSGAAFDALGSLTFSHDGKSLGYAARKGAMAHWVIDSRVSATIEISEAKRLGFGLWFSRDLSLVHLNARDSAGRRFVIIRTSDGKELLRMPHFAYSSPDFRRCTYTVDDVMHVKEWRTGKTRSFPGASLAHSWMHDDRVAVGFVENPKGTNPLKWFKIDGVAKPSRKYQEVATPVFSAVHNHFAFWARRNSKSYVVVDGVETEAFDHPVNANPFGLGKECLAFQNPRLIRTIAIHEGMVVELQIKISTE